MATRYGMYCPVAIATEILGERWTILVVMAKKIAKKIGEYRTQKICIIPVKSS
jgi:hypothetical protein